MKKLMMIGLVTLPLLGGCATKMQTGTAIGALTGGALAYGLGQDSQNKELWTVLGIGLGAMVGSNIGQQLDERDRMLMGQTFNHTMEKAPINATGQWQNPDTGHGGSVTPTRTFATETGTPCRQMQLRPGTARRRPRNRCRWSKTSHPAYPQPLQRSR